MATAEQIHERGREAFKKIQIWTTGEGQEWALRCQQVLMLEEIAAQLAEMNAHLTALTTDEGAERFKVHVIGGVQTGSGDF